MTSLCFLLGGLARDDNPSAPKELLSLLRFHQKALDSRLGKDTLHILSAVKYFLEGLLDDNPPRSFLPFLAIEPTDRPKFPYFDGQRFMDSIDATFRASFQEEKYRIHIRHFDGVFQTTARRTDGSITSMNIVAWFILLHRLGRFLATFISTRVYPSIMMGHWVEDEHREGEEEKREREIKEGTDFLLLEKGMTSVLETLSSLLPKDEYFSVANLEQLVKRYVLDEMNMPHDIVTEPTPAEMARAKKELKQFYIKKVLRRHEIPRELWEPYIEPDLWHEMVDAIPREVREEVTEIMQRDPKLHLVWTQSKRILFWPLLERWLPTLSTYVMAKGVMTVDETRRTVAEYTNLPILSGDKGKEFHHRIARFLAELLLDTYHPYLQDILAFDTRRGSRGHIRPASAWRGDTVDDDTEQQWSGAMKDHLSGGSAPRPRRDGSSRGPMVTITQAGNHILPFLITSSYLRKSVLIDTGAAAFYPEGHDCRRYFHAIIAAAGGGGEEALRKKWASEGDGLRDALLTDIYYYAHQHCLELHCIVMDRDHLFVIHTLLQWAHGTPLPAFPPRTDRATVQDVWFGTKGEEGAALVIVYPEKTGMKQTGACPEMYASYKEAFGRFVDEVKRHIYIDDTNLVTELANIRRIPDRVPADAVVAIRDLARVAAESRVHYCLSECFQVWRRTIPILPPALVNIVRILCPP